MTEPRRLRCYEYVDRPFSQVHDLLHRDPVGLLQNATNSAASRASSLAASLKVGMAGVQIGVDVRVYVQRVRDEQGIAGLSPVTCVELAWEAERAPGLFPSMQAELCAWPLSAMETQLEIRGDYRPPFGAVGNAIDAAVGHRIAEASIHRFLDEIVEQVRRELPRRS